MAFGRHDFHDGSSPEVGVQVLRDYDRDGQILGALQYVARGRDEVQQVSDVALEDRLQDAQGDVRTNIEQGPAEFLHRHGVHVSAHKQRREPRRPRPVVRPHGVEQLVQIFLLEAAKVVRAVQVPAYAHFRRIWRSDFGRSI